MQGNATSNKLYLVSSVLLSKVKNLALILLFDFLRGSLILLQARLTIKLAGPSPKIFAGSN